MAYLGKACLITFQKEREREEETQRENESNKKEDVVYVLRFFYNAKKKQFCMGGNFFWKQYKIWCEYRDFKILVCISGTDLQKWKWNNGNPSHGYLEYFAFVFLLRTIIY